MALIVSVLAFGGCGKAQPPPAPPTSNGIVIELPKLEQSLASASVEVKKALTDVQFGVRYDNYEKALAALNKIAADPSITEDQKKVVNAVIEQVKQAANKPRTPPAS